MTETELDEANRRIQILSTALELACKHLISLAIWSSEEISQPYVDILIVTYVSMATQETPENASRC